MLNSTKLKNLIVDLKNVTYSQNIFNHKEHEKCVEKILIENGFTLNNLELYYIYQPNGSQMPPDFKVYDKDEYIDIECKSKKSGYKPMWNCSMPLKDTFYIYTNQKDNKTLVIKGDQIITDKLHHELNNYKNETKLLANKYNIILQNLSENDNPYKFGVYARNMFVQNKHFESG